MTDSASSEHNRWVVCSCGNLIHVGQGSVKENREVRDHPACGRKPNLFRIPSVSGVVEEALQ